MLSGIGHRDELAEHDIECRVHLPGVGENLQDHLFVPLIHRASKPLTMDLKGLDKFAAIARYLLTGGGPVASQALEAMAFLHTDDIPALDAGSQVLPSAVERPPNLQLHFVCAGGHNPVAAENLGYPKDWHADVEAAMGTLPTLLHPKSVGCIRIDSADPFAAPVIVPNYLEHPDDMRVLVQGLKFARKIHSAAAFYGYVTDEVIDEEIAAKFHPWSDDYLMEFIRKAAVTVYHPGIFF